jgi:hypothetical protein
MENIYKDSFIEVILEDHLKDYNNKKKLISDLLHETIVVKIEEIQSKNSNDETTTFSFLTVNPNKNFNQTKTIKLTNFRFNIRKFIINTPIIIIGLSFKDHIKIITSVIEFFTSIRNSISINCKRQVLYILTKTITPT